MRSESRTTVDEEKVEEAIRYAHGTGFDEGYEVGWQEGFDEGVASCGALDLSADDRLEDEG